jgi:DNA-binding MarR family transcriptional regulator
MTVEIPVSDFMHSRDNVSLVKLLKAIAQLDPQDCSTKKLSWRTVNSQSQGLRLIERAERMGLIVRTGKKLPHGGGRKRVASLSKKGRDLLEQLSSS